MGSSRTELTATADGAEPVQIEPDLRLRQVSNLHADLERLRHRSRLSARHGRIANEFPAREKATAPSNYNRMYTLIRFRCRCFFLQSQLSLKGRFQAPWREEGSDCLFAVELGRA